MNKQEWIEAFLFASLRSASLIIAALAVYGILTQAFESFYRFDPSYLGTFLISRFSRPLLLLLVGMVLWFSAKPLARVAAK